ncbi:MAG: long-chain fatty acid--CoA ligase, partial [Firmicutes bacterium]|nr:long-chain fatty acid--CoA ligase [Bacillota bacterium]
MVVVTVNSAYKMKEAEYVLRQSESAGVFCVEEFRGHNMLATAKQISENLPTLKEVICFSDFEDFMNSASKPEMFPEVKPLDAAMIIYTSGTTGFPKGAMLHHMGLVNYGVFESERLGMKIGGVWANPMPLFHFSGCAVSFLATIMRGGTHVLVPAFDPLSYLEIIESENVTDAFLVPTMIEALVAKFDPNKHNVMTFKNILSGASKVEAALVNKVSSILGCRLAIAYGQTETHGAITQTHSDDALEDQTETIGQPYPLIEFK